MLLLTARYCILWRVFTRYAPGLWTRYLRGAAADCYIRELGVELWAQCPQYTGNQSDISQSSHQFHLISPVVDNERVV